MKSIVFVIESLDCGGAEKSVVTLLNNLDYNTYKVDLILIKKGGEFEKFLPSDVRVTYINIFSGFNTLMLLFARLKFWLFRKIDTKDRYHSSQHFWSAFGRRIDKNSKTYDIAIAYGQGFPTYFVLDKVIAATKYSWLNTDHQKLGYNPSFDYKKYCKYNGIVAVSEESGLSLKKAMKSIGKELPIEIIKDISDKEMILKMSNEDQGFLDQKDDDIKILTVCRLVKEKGLNLALEACEILHHKKIGFKWYVIGEGFEREQLEQQIASKGLQDHFILMGFKENPYSFMKTCDIYVQSSLFEGLGLTVIEAAILCKPIVTTNFPTASTIVTHKETGLISEMTSAAIAEQILKYIEDNAFMADVIDRLAKQTNNDKATSLDKFNKLMAKGF